MASLSEDLKAELATVFMVGFLDAMAGTPVEDEDVSSRRKIAPPLIEMAQGCIERTEDKIAEIYAENPSEVYEAVYQVGVELCRHSQPARRTSADQPQLGCGCGCGRMRPDVSVPRRERPSECAPFGLSLFFDHRPSGSPKRSTRISEGPQRLP